MQTSIFEVLEDFLPQYSDKKVMIGLSGGINSMAVLAYLKKYVKHKPKNLYLFYAHFEEHSDDTKELVLAGVEYAKKHFPNVHFEMTDNSILNFFEKSKMIPHPMISPCTRILKIEPMLAFAAKHKIDKDLVGYVREESKRIKRQISKLESKGLSGTKDHTIAHLSNEDCFSLVKSEIGWFPEIYNVFWTDERILPYLEDNKDSMSQDAYRVAKKYATAGYNKYKNTTRVFAHNNCLPCKNMGTWEMEMIKLFFPKKYKKAEELACRIGQHWGRDTEQSASCTHCEFD